MAVFETLIAIFLILVIVAIFAKGVVIVQPYEQGLQIRLGQYVGRMNPGFRWIVPFVSEAIKLDLRTTVIDIPSQEVITKDNSPTNVDAIIYIRVIDPEKAYLRGFKLPACHGGTRPDKPAGDYRGHGAG